MQHIFYLPRVMKIGQVEVLFAVTSTKKKRRITYKNSFKGYIVIYTDGKTFSKFRTDLLLGKG